MSDAGEEILRAKARCADEDGAKPSFRKTLRNANINYSSGWFFVTSQVAHNKSIFGAIVGEKVVLNELGQSVWEYWQGLPATAQNGLPPRCTTNQRVTFRV